MGGDRLLLEQPPHYTRKPRPRGEEPGPRPPTETPLLATGGNSRLPIALKGTPRA